MFENIEELKEIQPLVSEKLQSVYDLCLRFRFSGHFWRYSNY